ncbi:MAG: class I SAM-dependent methyltransferase [Ruminococcaceae bacterium]|nr:class I SAM-dependent methyltransferase [Oscillospiraceae bacterium]
MSYSFFAKYYDNLTANVDYSANTDYILKIFKKYDRVPTLLLDVGCGTGGFSLEFAKRGIDVIGVDPSEDMLTVAKEKADKEGLDLLFLNQSGEEMDLFGTVNGVICCLDTINHIVCKRTLQRLFNKISLFLEDDRLFIFDVNTEFKHKTVLGDNCFVFDDEGTFVVWQNFYDSKSKITDIKLDFFKEDTSIYKRETEEFSERVYSNDELIKMLDKSGFKVETILENGKFIAPDKKSQRNIFVARKERQHG